MNAREFCYWLQGYLELRVNKNCEITKEQATVIQNHLNLVFHHDIDPSTPGDQAAMQAIHDGKMTFEQATKEIGSLLSKGFTTSTTCGELHASPKVSEVLKAFLVDYHGVDASTADVTYVSDLFKHHKIDQHTGLPKYGGASKLGPNGEKIVMRC